MSTPLTYSMSNDSVMVIFKGEPHTVTKGMPNYQRLRDALNAEDWDKVPDLLSVEKVVEVWSKDWLKGQEGFAIKDDKVVYKGEALPEELSDRILKMSAKDEPATAMLNFWRRLKRNPNKHSVQQLWAFLKHTGIPIQDDGTFLAYKGVRRDFRDAHSGTFDNSPGKVVKMDRSKISTDPNHACHAGLHVGALSYARNFSQMTVIVRVDPEHVCCVPNDHSAMKMRVCEYAVTGIYGGQMPDTHFNDDIKVAPKAKSLRDDDEDDRIEEGEEDDDCYEGYEGDSDDVEDEDDSDDIEGTEDDEDEDAPLVVETLTNEPPKVIKPADQGDQLPLTGTPWDNLNGLDKAGLLGESLESLRKYARYNCMITGASKLPGGKEVLVNCIIEVRDAGKVQKTDVAPAEVPKPKPAPKAKPAPKPVQETQPLPKEAPAAVSLPLTGTDWDHMNGMNSLELLAQPIEDLRKYARFNCMIVGASKIPGGKEILVQYIVDARNDTVEKPK